MHDDLLTRVARGDRAAVNECIARYGALVWSLARRWSPTATDAEDAVQEVFLELWRSAAKYDPSVSSEAAFIAMIARRRLIDRRRARGRRVETEPIEDSAAAAPLDGGGPTAETCAEAAFAARAVAQLRPEEQRVLLLATCHGMSHEEIASSTGMPLGTVKTHVRRALMRVRAALAGEAEVAS